MVQSRWKSPVLWTSVAALVVYVLKTFVRMDLSREINGLVDVLLPVLAAFGIINNPTSKNSM